MKAIGCLFILGVILAVAPAILGILVGIIRIITS